MAPQKNQRSLRFLLAEVLTEPAGAPPLGGSTMLLHLLLVRSHQDPMYQETRRVYARSCVSSDPRVHHRNQFR